MEKYNQLTPEIIAQIQAVSDHVLTGDDINADFARDEMPIYGTHMPDLVVQPTSTEAVSYTHLMFPKAHAAAYVMMAWRVAYCKVFYPLAYYAAFFSIRANGFSYELMCLGRDKLEYHLADFKKRSDSLSKAEQDTLRDMRIVQEMYARGYDLSLIHIW